jgi:mannose-1-phosphate guanylyltransferase
VIGRDGRVGDGATIERSVLLDGCVVEEGAAVSNSILSGGVTVAAGADLDGAVIGEGETVAATEEDMRGRPAGEAEERPVS